MKALDTTPYWLTSAALPEFPALDRDLDVDVCVIGGGITGLTAAYLLKRAKKRVALIERATCGAIDTGHTTAHVTCVTDLMLSELVDTFGKSHAEAVWDAGLAAMHQIDTHVQRDRIACDLRWVPAYLHTPIRGDASADREDLQKEAQIAEELGFDARFMESVPFVKRPGVEFPNQALFHPGKYLAAIARLVDGGGSCIFERTESQDVQDDPLTVTANGRKIRCEYLVIATHNPLVGKNTLLSATLFQTKLSLYSTYVVAGRIPKGRAPRASFWDTADPYHYLRIDPQGDHDFAILGGEDHKTGQVEDTTACYARLEETLKEMLPGVEVTHRWSGQVINTNDGLPFIGESAERQFVATGFSGNGMTFGTLAGMMACDRAQGFSNPWSDLFDVSRRKIRGGAWDYVKENKDYPYYLIRDRFAGADGKSLRSVPRGEGHVIEMDGEKVAAYRDDAGDVTLRSPICTHMACIVEWNTAEKTWDCPCHGSRFTPAGDVISGPAESPLGEVKQKELAEKR